MIRLIVEINTGSHRVRRGCTRMRVRAYARARVDAHVGATTRTVRAAG